MDDSLIGSRTPAPADLPTRHKEFQSQGEGEC